MSGAEFMTALDEFEFGEYEGETKPQLGDVWFINRINVPERIRGKGHGTWLLKRILKDADAEHVTLCLGPIATGGITGLTQQELENWYERHGFVWQVLGGMPCMVREAR